MASAVLSGCSSSTPAQQVAEEKNNPYASDVLEKAMFDVRTARARAAETERKYALGTASYSDVMKNGSEELFAELALNRCRRKLNDGDPDDLAEEEEALVRKILKNYDEHLEVLERKAAGGFASESDIVALKLAELSFKIRSAKILGLSSEEKKALDREFKELARSKKFYSDRGKTEDKK